MPTTSSLTSSLRLAAMIALPATALLAQSIPTPGDDEVVDLDRFTVTTTLQSYATPTASVASKVDVPLQETPFTVQILNNALIADLRAETLADLYPYITGLSASGLRADSFTLRGFDTGLETIQVNGLPGKTTVFGSPSSAAIERIEVLKGPASVLYGQLEPGGLVNLVTKRPQAVARTEIFASVSTFAGRTSEFADDNGLRTTLDSTGPLTNDGRWLYRVIASHETNASFRDDVSEEKLQIAPALTWLPRAGTSLTAELEWVDEKGRADDGLVAPGNDISRIASINTRYQAAGDTDNDKGLALGLTADHRLTDTWTTQASWRSVWHEDNRILFENNALVTVAGQPMLRRRYRDQFNEREYHFLDWQLRGDLHAGPVRHQLLAGLNGGRELRWFDRRSLGPTVGNVALYSPYTDLARPTAVPESLRETWLTNYGVYVGDQVTVGQRWHGFLGARYNAQDVEWTSVRAKTVSDQSTDAVVPSAGLVYDLTETWSLYTSYGESFVPASVEQEDINGDNGLPPKEGAQWEAGAKFTAPDGRRTFSVALFDIVMRNVTESLGVTNPNGNTAYGLLGETRSRGLELDGQWQPLPHLQLRTGYSYIDAEVTESRTATQIGATPQNAARHQGHAWARYNIPSGRLKGFGIGLGLIGQSEREVVTTTVAASKVTLPSYLRTDLALYHTRGRYSVALNIKNLTDELYFAGGTSAIRIYPAAPRELVLSVRTRF